MRASTVLPVILLMTLAAAVSCGKPGYKVERQTPADYISWQQDASDSVDHSGDECVLPATPEGGAYQYLEAILESGWRRTGTEQYRCAELFVKRAFDEMGYVTEEVTYNFPYYDFDLEETSVVRDRDGKEYDAYPMHFGMTMFSKRTGKLVKPGKNLTGSFVYVKGGIFSGDIRQKYTDWMNAGALGVIVEASLKPMAAEGLVHSRRAHSTSYHYAPLPGFIVADAKELLGETITVHHNAKIKAGRGYTIAARSPKASDSYVLVTAHLDSWFDGALDDGSGAAVMLEVARMMKDDPRGVIFLAADSEEIGLIGSAAYVVGADMDRIEGVLELDMVSSLNNYKYDTPEGASLMPRIITNSRGMKKMSKKHFGGLSGKNHQVPMWLNRAVFGGLATDMEWFYSYGIPGTFIYTPSYYYHTKKDTIEWIPEDDIQEVAKASAGFVRDMRSEMDSLPKPPKVIEFEFDAVMSGDTISFEVEGVDGPGFMSRVEVITFIEFGYEGRVELEKEDDGVWRGEMRPPYKGRWQFLATVEKGRKLGKRWASLDVPRVTYPAEYY